MQTNNVYRFGLGENWEMQALLAMIGRRVQFQNYWTYETSVRNVI